MKSKALLLALCLCLLAAPAARGDGFTSAQQAELEAVLERHFGLFQTMGACVTLIQNGQVTFTYCYGLQRAGGEAVTPECGFQVGSISKLVSNIGLMQLVEQDRAGLDQDLSELFGFAFRNPAFPDDPITLRQLMTHTAGLRDSVYYQQALEGRPEALDALFESPRRNALFYRDTAPGTRSEYCNFGGGLIGSLIENLSGQTLDDYMQEHVFEPLGITASYLPARLLGKIPLCDLYHMPEKRLAKRMADDTTDILYADASHDYFLSAGKLVISAPDLSKLLIALCDGGVYGNHRLLKESTMREMTTLQNARGSVSCDSGRGLFMNILTDVQVEGRRMYGHGGKALGMLCAAYYDPLDRTGVVMLTNGCRNTSSARNVGLLGRAVMADLYAALDATQIHEVVSPFRVE